MGFQCTESLPRESHPTAKNRVWGFFGETPESRPEKSAAAQQPRRVDRPTATKAASGVRYYGYRYFDPVTGRWPSRDPIGENGGINLYEMVGNDAVNFADILGLDQFRVKYIVEGTIEDEGVLTTSFDKVEVGDLRALVDVELISDTELVAIDSNVLKNQTGKQVVVDWDIVQMGEEIHGNGEYWPDIEETDHIWREGDYEHARLNLSGGLKVTNGHDCGDGNIGVLVDFKVIVSAGTITDTEKKTFGLELGGKVGKDGVAEGNASATWGWESGYSTQNQGYTVEGIIRYKLCPCVKGPGTWASEYVSSEGEAVGDSNADKWHSMNHGLLRSYFHRY